MYSRTHTDKQSEIVYNNVHSHRNMDSVTINNNVYSHKSMDRDTSNSTKNIQHLLPNHNNIFRPLPGKAITPVNTVNFENCLSHHPDQDLVNYLANELRNGFDIAYTASHTVTRPNNLLSATEHQAGVTTALFKEVSRGHTAGPFDAPPFTALHWGHARKRTAPAGSSWICPCLKDNQ